MPRNCATDDVLSYKSGESIVVGAVRLNVRLQRPGRVMDETSINAPDATATGRISPALELISGE